MKKVLTTLLFILTLVSCVKKEVKMVYYEVYFTDKTKDTLYLPNEYYVNEDNTLYCYVEHQWIPKASGVKYVKELKNN